MTKRRSAMSKRMPYDVKFKLKVTKCAKKTFKQSANKILFLNRITRTDGSQLLLKVLLRQRIAKQPCTRGVL